MTRARLMLSAALAVLCAGTVAARADENLMNALTGREVGATACFARSYTPDFLAKHPKQRIARIDAAIYVGKGGPDEGRWLWIGLQEKGKTATVYGTGGCAWQSRDVNRDADGHLVLPSFKKHSAAAVCLMSVGLKHSDEHNGPRDTVIDIAPDGRSITIFADDFMPVLTGSPAHWTRTRKKLGPEDRIFRLERTDASCSSLNAGLDTLE